MQRTAKTKHYAAMLLLALTLFMHGAGWAQHLVTSWDGGIASTMACPGESEGDVCE